MHKANSCTKAFEDSEWQANCYAGCLMIPKPAILKIVASEKDMDLSKFIRLVAETFGSSLMVAYKRLEFLEKNKEIDLGIIKTTYRNLFPY
jgi:hypothetical protein